MSIILARLDAPGWSYGSSLAPGRHCRLDPSSSQHGAYVDEGGVFHYQHIDATSSTVTTLLSFELQFRAAEAAQYEPVGKPWAFEFVPGAPGDLLLVQEGSCRILYASLPKQGTDSSDVFLFGSHTAPVRCISTNGNLLLSGCQDGGLKLWRLSDGQLADAVTLPDGASITALTTLGPLLVAAGSSSSTVTLYDLSSGRLLAVQRLMAGPGSVLRMAAWLPPEVLAGANLAPGGPLSPDGGGVLPPRAWDSPGRTGAAAAAPGAGSSRQQARTLLAVASSSGWLCVFGTVQHSSHAWSLIHSTGSLVAPSTHTQLAFSPDGTTLAVASPAAQLLGTDAVSLAAAGAQPGAVSLYQVATQGGAPTALLPPLLLEQEQRQQLPELLLWHQWSLASTPVGLAVLPSSGLQLLHGKQLHPSQVLRLYAVPQVGPGQVLTAERRLDPGLAHTHRSHSSPVRAAAADATAGTATAGTATAGTATAGTATATSGLPPAASQGVALEAGLGQSVAAERPSAAAAAAVRASSGGCSSSSGSRSRWDEAEEALLLNIAERDLAEVAQAIAAAAGPSLDAELAELLAGATAGQLVDAAAIQAAAAAAVRPKSAGVSTAAGAACLHEEQAQQHGSPRAAAAAFAPAAGGAAAASLEGGAAGGTALRLPRTLPGVRSWRDAADGADPAGGTGAPQAGSFGGLAALAQSLHEEQQRLAQQRQQQQQQQQHEAPQDAVVQVNSGAGAATADDSHVPVHDPELPSESSLQHLLQGGEGSRGTEQQHPQQQQQQQQLMHQSDQPQLRPHGAGPSASCASPSTPDSTAPVAAAAAALQAEAPESVTVAVGAAAAAVPPPRSQPEPEPQPRRLPAMLLQQRAPAAVQRDQAPAAARPTGPGVLHSLGGSSSRGVLDPASALQHGSREAAEAAAEATQGRLAPTSSVPQAAGVAQDTGDSSERVQQLQQQRGAAPLPGAQGGQAPLGVKERLNLRRQEVLARRQQQQQQQQQQRASGVPAAAAAAGSQRDRWGPDAALPASDHPLAAAVQNSSRLLAAKIQEAEQAPDVTIDPRGPAAVKLAVARLANLDLSPEQQQYDYQALPDLKDVPTPTQAPKLVPKQLDAHWVASRSLKPCMDTLFRPRDWQQGFVDPQVLLLPAWPSPQDVVRQLL